MAEGATGDTGAPQANRRAVGATCVMHRGPRGFANLVLEKRLKPDGAEIILDPHVTGACVMILDEDTVCPPVKTLMIPHPSATFDLITPTSPSLAR